MVQAVDNNHLFDIRNFLDRLTPAKKKNKYICPVCGGNNLAISDDPSKSPPPYQCFNGCSCEDIREAIKPWSEVLEERRSLNVVPRQPRQPKPKPKDPSPAPLPKGILRIVKLSSTATDSPKPEPQKSVAKCVKNALLSKGVTEAELKEVTKTTYDYGSGKSAHRYQCPCMASDKGREKTFFISHVAEDGQVLWKKGSRAWDFYRQEEAVSAMLAVSKKFIPVLPSHEGEKKVEFGRAEGLAGITCVGGATEEELFRNFSYIKFKMDTDPFIVAHCQDNDKAGMEKAQKLAKAAARAKVPFVIIDLTKIQPDLCDKGGIDDLLEQGMTGDELAEAILQQIEERRKELELAEKQDAIATTNDSVSKWTQSSLSEVIAEEYRPKLAWHVSNKAWYWYGRKLDGVWSEASDEMIGRMVTHEAKARLGATFKHDFISGTIKFLKYELAVEDWQEAQGLIPMQDGVLDPATMNLLPHSPGYRFLWHLPYEWKDRAIGCQPIVDWLCEFTKGDAQLMQLHRAYLKAVVMGRYDLQRFLELIGPGGTGKGTLQRLAMALVGEENTQVTTLKQLEGNRFETASLYGKRLVVITDSERYGGEVSVLKALTGQDPIRNERKGVQQTKGFTFTGMIMVAANEAIQSSDYTSGLKRRRLTVPCTNQVAENKRRNLDEEFKPYLPGVLQWVLEMPDSEMVNLVVNTEKAVRSLANFSAEFLLDTNPLADWLDNCVVVQPNSKTYVGTMGKSAELFLYPSYCKWMDGIGSKALSLRRFSECLIDLCKNQLKLQGITKGRDNQGAYITGISLRDATTEHLLRPITSDGLVTDSDGLSDGSVTGQTRTSDGSDGCDGSNPNQHIKHLGDGTSQPTNNDLDSRIKEKTGDEVKGHPSHPSHPSPTMVSAVTDPSLVTSQSVTTPQLPPNESLPTHGFEVGQKVTVTRDSHADKGKYLEVTKVGDKYIYCVIASGKKQGEQRIYTPDEISSWGKHR